MAEKRVGGEEDGMEGGHTRAGGMSRVPKGSEGIEAGLRGGSKSQGGTERG